jgi:hypothetical protein
MLVAFSVVKKTTVQVGFPAGSAAPFSSEQR